MVDVAYSAPIFPPYDEPGSPVYYEQLTAELSKHHDVHVVAPFCWGAPLVETRDGITVYRLVLRRDYLPSPVRAILEATSAFLLSLGLLLARSLDCCHVHSTSYAAPGFAVAATMTRTPLYYDCRDENFPSWLVARGPTAKWFSCATNIDERLLDCGVPEADIVRLPVVNPKYVGEYTRQPGLVSDAGLDVLFVGRLLEDKGVFTLAEAIARLGQAGNGVSLTYVGDGPASAALTDSVADLGIEDRVDFRGQLPHRETLAEMASHDVLVLPSRSEGVPRVIVEAFEIGLPVVATPVGGIPDVVDNGTTGVLVDEDPDEIAHALADLTSDPEKAAAVASNAATLSDGWTWSAVESQVTEAYLAGTR